MTLGNVRAYEFLKVLLFIRMDFGNNMPKINGLKHFFISETGICKKNLCFGGHYVANQRNIHDFGHCGLYKHNLILPSSSSVIGGIMHHLFKVYIF